ncbi:ATP-binding protein [Paenibacillus sp. J5C_2022]|uniref:ATP-binding protein n=1 Tax=Paenibacillus sp. J5C2022 TaxID=2977129 RepID=UPI0021CF2BE6|nr:ATP-binding protein [Paenibacillus sp. J5C2022]MCU6707889.1 ATP-binding protein [Paenibacillus sp. J5C2022]
MTRNYGQELDEMEAQLAELREIVLSGLRSGKAAQTSDSIASLYSVPATELETAGDNANYANEAAEDGTIHYSGWYTGAHEQFRYKWEPQRRNVAMLLGVDGDKTSRVLGAIAHKQRLDILRALMGEPLTGAELVERLNMGTTGQLYHHTKALLGAGLLVQEERGGQYMLPGKRTLPVLLLLAAVSELLDASDYIELAEARDRHADYLGEPGDGYSAVHMVRSILENVIQEHEAGFCTQVAIILHSDGHVTIADNGRGITLQAFADSEKPRVQAILTELSRNASASVHAPGSVKGITLPVVNALSRQLTVEVRREGKVVRQTYGHGIPQTGLLTVGLTEERGTSLTFQPDPDIFLGGIDLEALSAVVAAISDAHPALTVTLLQDG